MAVSPKDKIQVQRVRPPLQDEACIQEIVDQLWEEIHPHPIWVVHRLETIRLQRHHHHLHHHHHHINQIRRQQEIILNNQIIKTIRNHLAVRRIFQLSSFSDYSSIIDDQQSINEDVDQSKQQQQQRNQPPNSSNNQSNTASAVRPSQLHTQPMKQQPQQQTPSSNTIVPPPLALPNQDDHSSSHEPINPNQSDPTIHISNAPVYAPLVAAGQYVSF